MEPLKLTYYGNPILRKRAEPIQEITAELRELAIEMVKFMDANNGIGIAAPQVGRSIRLFVLRSYGTDAEGKLYLTDPQAYINPVISNYSEEVQTDEEGCLSIPGMQEEVTRPLKITVEATDLDGNVFREDLEGYKARVVMHENDHLNGVLYIDRIDPNRRKAIEPELKILKKAYKDK